MLLLLLVLSNGTNAITFYSLSFVYLCRKNSSNLEKFQMRIRKRELYSIDDRYIDRVITDMVKLPILHVGKLIRMVVYWVSLVLQGLTLLVTWVMGK